jgi:hypothetical protein
MYVPLALTLDHRPDRPEEGARILAAGGRVALGQYEGGRRGNLPRVFMPSGEGPGLAVSRCLGYTAASSLGVTSTPDVITHRLAPNDRFLIIASDGLWAVLSSEEAVAVVGRVVDSVLWGGSADADAAEASAAAAAGRGGLLGASSTGALGHTNASLALTSAASAIPVGHFSGGGGDGAASGALAASLTASEALVHASTWLPAATAALRSPGSGLAPEDAALIAQASTADPRRAPMQRSVSAAIAHPAPLTHATPSPAVEARVSVVAGEAPAAGCGGGSDVPMDLGESLLPPQARELRVRRRRVTALAAAEALVAAARARWREQAVAVPGSGGQSHRHLSGAASAKAQHDAAAAQAAAAAAPWDDISVLVVLFEH